MSNLFQTTTGGASTIKINVSGQTTLHRVAELCTVNFNVVHESTDRKDTVIKVTEKSNELSTLLQGLAPARLASSAAAMSQTVTIEEADQNAEERDIDKPVAKWSMSTVSTSSYIPYNPDRSDTDPNASRKYQTSTTFAVTFRDFGKLEAFVGDLTRDELVRVADLDWRITRRTREALQTVVRQGALRNAMKKAQDYAAVYSSGTVKPVEINDGFNTGRHDDVVYANAVYARAAPPMGGDDNNQPDFSFQPDEIAVSANVQVRFVVEA